MAEASASGSAAAPAPAPAPSKPKTRVVASRFMQNAAAVASKAAATTAAADSRSRARPGVPAMTATTIRVPARSASIGRPKPAAAPPAVAPAAAVMPVVTAAAPTGGVASSADAFVATALYRGSPAPATATAASAATPAPVPTVDVAAEPDAAASAPVIPATPTAASVASAPAFAADDELTAPIVVRERQSPAKPARAAQSPALTAATLSVAASTPAPAFAAPALASAPTASSGGSTSPLRGSPRGSLSGAAKATELGLGTGKRGPIAASYQPAAALAAAAAAATAAAPHTVATATASSGSRPSSAGSSGSAVRAAAAAAAAANPSAAGRGPLAVRTRKPLTATGSSGSLPTRLTAKQLQEAVASDVSDRERKLKMITAGSATTTPAAATAVARRPSPATGTGATKPVVVKRGVSPARDAPARAPASPFVIITQPSTPVVGTPAPAPASPTARLSLTPSEPAAVSAATPLQQPSSASSSTHAFLLGGAPASALADKRRLLELFAKHKTLLLQWQLVNARSRAAFARQQRSALAQLTFVSGANATAERALHEAQRQLITDRHINAVEHALAVQHTHLQQLIPKLQALGPFHTALTSVLADAQHRLPLHHAVVDVPRLVTQLYSSAAHLTRIRTTVSKHFDQLVAFANNTRLTAANIDARLTELARAKQLLLALTALENMERSLRVHCMQLDEQKRMAEQFGADDQFSAQFDDAGPGSGRESADVGDAGDAPHAL